MVVFYTTLVVVMEVKLERIQKVQMCKFVCIKAFRCYF